MSQSYNVQSSLMKSETVFLLTWSTVSYTSVAVTFLSIHTSDFICKSLQNKIPSFKQLCILSSLGHSKVENKQLGLVLLIFCFGILGAKMNQKLQQFVFTTLPLENY